MKLSDAPWKDPEEPWTRQYRKPSRLPAPALTAEEAAIVAVFEAAPFPAEVLLSHLESVRAALASPAPAPQGEEACTKRTSSAHEDEVTYECGRPATVEALTTSGQWEPHCAPHVAGWPSDRVRSR